MVIHQGSVARERTSGGWRYWVSNGSAAGKYLPGWSSAGWHPGLAIFAKVGCNDCWLPASAKLQPSIFTSGLISGQQSNSAHSRGTSALRRTRISWWRSLAPARGRAGPGPSLAAVCGPGPNLQPRQPTVLHRPHSAAGTTSILCILGIQPSRATHAATHARRTNWSDQICCARCVRTARVAGAALARPRGSAARGAGSGEAGTTHARTRAARRSSV